MKPIDVFISHATGDDDAVTEIAKALAAANLTVWVDHLKGLGPGMRDWRGGIQDALDACKAGILVLSPRALKREEIDFECEYLLKERKGTPFFLLILEKVKKPYYLTRLNHTDLTKDWQRGMAAVAETLGHRLGLYPPKITGEFSTEKLELKLIGRTADVEDVERLLATEIRAVTIRGLGGVGKTRLAAEVVDRARRASAVVWRDGIIWHRIEAHTTAEDLTAQIRTHLLGPKSTKPTPVVWEALRGAHLLLVLDNAEACQDRHAYAELLNTLDPTGRVRVLLTSRARWSEVRNSEMKPLGKVSADVGEAILREMLRANRPEQTIEPAQVAELAQEAHYHPGLMEWAVRWLHKLPVTSVVAALHELKGHDAEAALEEMVGRTVALVEREPGGAAAIAALRRLAVCRGGCTPEAAAHLAVLRADGLDLAQLLHTWGLLLIVGNRYEIDPLVLASVTPDATAHPAHLDYYKALTEQHDQKQDYLGFDPESANLEAAFEWAMATGETAKAYWLVNAAAKFLQNRGRFAQKLAWFQQVEAVFPSDADPALRAALDVSLGNSYGDQPMGNHAANLQRAIGAYEKALQHRTEAAAPLDYAMTQNNLGLAYWYLSGVEDRAGNLRRAIGAYENALRYCTEAAAPLNYGATQNNLGNAYCNLAAVEDRATNLRRAIEAYENALRHRTEAAAPLDYAMTQNNLGNAYGDLAAVEDRAENLRRAIGAYENALRHRTEAAAPLDYAGTQNNLGSAYGDLAAVEDRVGNLRRAIGAFENALRHRTEAAAPLAYAQTQNNLGNAYWSLAEVEDRAGNLRRAIGAYENALRHHTEAAAPRGYAMTQHCLGITYEAAADLPAAITCWQHAERAYRNAGDTTNADLMLEWIKEAQAQLATPPSPET